MFYNTLCSLQYFQGFTVIKSNSIYETYNIINSYDHKINKDFNKKPFYIENSNNTYNKILNTTEYCNYIKSEKKANITKDNIWILFLKQIPYISTNIAIEILKTFPSIPELIQNIKDNPIHTTNLLNNIKITSNSQKSRKLSSKVIDNIIHLLS